MDAVKRVDSGVTRRHRGERRRRQSTEGDREYWQKRVSEGGKRDSEGESLEKTLTREGEEENRSIHGRR